MPAHAVRRRRSPAVDKNEIYAVPDDEPMSLASCCAAHVAVEAIGDGETCTSQDQANNHSKDEGERPHRASLVPAS
jgi:hypothetical protein